MPRLLSQRSSVRRRKLPPCGRIITYSAPHSPFQKLVDAARRRQKLSGRVLASKIVIDGKPTSQSTLWIWLHNLNGYPHPKSFSEDHLKQLAQALKISEAALRTALDASRHIFTPTETPVPHASFDSMARLIEILEHDRRKNVSRSYVLNLAKNLHNGSKLAAK